MHVGMPRIGIHASHEQIPPGRLLVNAPGRRYHPAIIAQAAATRSYAFGERVLPAQR